MTFIGRPAGGEPPVCVGGATSGRCCNCNCKCDPNERPRAARESSRLRGPAPSRQYGSMSAGEPASSGPGLARTGPAPAPEKATALGAQLSGRDQRLEADPPAGAAHAKGAQGSGAMLERAARSIPGLGIILALFASLFLGTAGMLVKMTQSVHGIQVAVFRATIQLAIYASIIAFRGLPLVPRKRCEWLPIAGRAILGGSSITLSYYALKLIPLGDATTIRFSLPIWTLIISYFLLGESCSLLKVVAVIICVSGVVLIAKPDDCVHYANLILHNLARLVSGAPESPGCQSINCTLTNWPLDNGTATRLRDVNGTLAAATATTAATTTAAAHLLTKLTTGPSDDTVRQLEGCLMALASSICLSLSLICLRLCKQTPTEITILWLSIASIVIGSSTLVGLNEFRMPNNLLDLIYILLNGLCGSIGQWFITSALKIEQSGIIALARTFDIEVAFLYSALLLHETIRTTSIVGSILVSSGVVIVVVPKWFEGLACGAESGAPKPGPDELAPRAAQLEAAKCCARLDPKPADESSPTLTTMTIVSLADEKRATQAHQQ